MTREDAIQYISVCVDDALCERSMDERPDNARLIGWQCGFEPLFVAVWSYIGCRLGDDEAVELAQDILQERQWFAGEPTEPDFIL